MSNGPIVIDISVFGGTGAIVGYFIDEFGNVFIDFIELYKWLFGGG